MCRRRGAEATVDYEREDLKSRIRELTNGGARVVIDPVGGRYAEQALRSLARGGVFVTLGYAAARFPRFRSIWFCSRTSPSAALRSGPSLPITVMMPHGTCVSCSRCSPRGGSGRISVPGSHCPTPQRRCDM